MIRTPPQHQTSPDKAPGQVRYHYVTEWPHKTSGQIVNDVTLADYIARKEKQYREKMTFDKWYALNSHYMQSMTTAEYSRMLWNAAQENM